MPNPMLNNTYIICAEKFGGRGANGKRSAQGFQFGFATPAYVDEHSHGGAPSNFEAYIDLNADDTINPNGRLWLTFYIRSTKWQFRNVTEGPFAQTPIVYGGNDSSEIVPLPAESSYGPGQGMDIVTIYNPNDLDLGQPLHFDLAIQKIASPGGSELWDPEIRNDGSGSTQRS